MSEASPRTIVITGFMAAGKTTVAKALARRLNCEMIDLDSIIVEHEKRTIPDLINKAGEETFRQAETYSLEIVLKGKIARIIALGGGAWMLERNRELIANHKCITVWLDAPFELCWERITNDDVARPLALDRESAHKLFIERRPQYELAQLRMKVIADKSADELASDIELAARRQRFVKS
ncbi:MAG TPA: shikimate kinase [Pyrinomonadaceae bacterium]|nr:shikimate kinase [Pyrinomonadaceae bacterium]